MATGRTLNKWRRVYIDGYDMSGSARSIDPLEITYDEADLTAPMSDTVKGYLRNHAHVNCGTLNSVFDNTATTGIHTVMITPASRIVLVAQGIRAAPAAGDPAFGGDFEQVGYTVENDGGAVTVSVPFSGWAVDAATLAYASPWGTLLHASGAETGANSANSSIDNPEEGATTKGGFFIYHVLAGAGGDGTATLSVDDSADNSSWLALSGATSGEIVCTSVQSGIVALANTATVRRYLRWQLSLNGATSVTFVCAFMRAY